LAQSLTARVKLHDECVVIDTQPVSGGLDIADMPVELFAPGHRYIFSVEDGGRFDPTDDLNSKLQKMAAEKEAQALAMKHQVYDLEPVPSPEPSQAKTRLTPNDIDVLLHYHGHADDHPRVDAPAVKQALNMWLGLGCLVDRESSMFGSRYKTTDKGRRMVERLCLTQIPE
jgi:hypothetical protein